MVASNQSFPVWAIPPRSHKDLLVDKISLRFQLQLPRDIPSDLHPPSFDRRLDDVIGTVPDRDYTKTEEPFPSRLNVSCINLIQGFEYDLFMILRVHVLQYLQTIGPRSIDIIEISRHLQDPVEEMSFRLFRFFNYLLPSDE